MKVEFEWHTGSLGDTEKEALEVEIGRKVSEHIGACVGQEVDSLMVLLHDDPGGFVVRGSAFYCEGDGSKNEVMKIAIGNGVLIQCNSTSFLRPG